MLELDRSINANVWKQQVHLMPEVQRPAEPRSSQTCSAQRPSSVPHGHTLDLSDVQNLSLMCCCQSLLSTQSRHSPALIASTGIVTDSDLISLVPLPAAPPVHQLSHPQPHFSPFHHTHVPSVACAFQTPTPGTT